MTSSPVVRLQEGAVPEAAAALARAFHQDPLQTYVFPDPGERAARSPAHFAPLLRYGLRYGEVYTTPVAPAGAAVCLGPEAWEVSPERAAAAGLDQLPEVLGAEAAQRFFSVLSAIEPFHYRDVPRAHWYVMVVGLEPAARGQGLGRALLRPMLERADADRLPCYLETAQPTNVAFYEHLGFRRVVEFVDPGSGLPLWTFRRDPSG